MFGLPAAAAKRRQPVETGEDAVLDRARLNLARPADDGGHAEAAFEHGALGGAERRHAAVGPSEDFRAVVGGEDDDGVVGFADVVQVLQQRADVVVQLRHAGFFDVVIALVIHHRLIFCREIGEDVHARRVVPDEERLAVLLGLVHEVRWYARRARRRRSPCRIWQGDLFARSGDRPSYSGTAAAGLRRRSSACRRLPQRGSSVGSSTSVA